MDSSPLAEEIAASIEDVKALLNDNRSLSIRLLANRLRELEDEVRRRFRELETCRTSCKALQTTEATVAKLEQRIEVAAVKFRELQNSLDDLKSKHAASLASGDTALDGNERGHHHAPEAQVRVAIDASEMRTTKH